jgi:chromatin segregation and condensation protein Rec8/ScpA/Scc1 (kleisin family)
MDKLTPVFIFLTGLAVMLQAGVLLAMYLAMRRSIALMEAMATEVKTKVVPTVEQAEALLTEISPKLQVITDNLQDATTMLRDQVQRVDATVKDVVDRSRLQIIRADELLTRTLDRVEQTTDMVHNTVISPVRRISGLMQGLTVGLEFLFGGRTRKNGNGREERRPVPQDEMFI